MKSLLSGFPVKAKLLNLLLIITSLFGYLEWGQHNTSFLFQIEYEVLRNLFNDPKSVVHPFTILPLFGQVLLLITLFLKEPNKILTYVGIGCLGLLLGLMFFIGILGINYKILISTLPFILTSIIAVRNYRQKSIKLNKAKNNLHR